MRITKAKISFRNNGTIYKNKKCRQALGSVTFRSKKAKKANNKYQRCATIKEFTGYTQTHALEKPKLSELFSDYIIFSWSS